MSKYNSDTCRFCPHNNVCIKSYGNPHDGCTDKFQNAKQKAHELVVTAIRTETAREIFDWLKTKNLLLAEVPEEGKLYQFTGCYITKWGKIDEPTLGMIRFSESNDLLDFKLRYGVVE